LYGLIWQRFVASQMAAAVYSVTGAQIYAGKQVGQPYPLEFRTQGRTLQFEGFLRVYEEPGDEDEDTPSDSLLPDLHEGQILTLVTPQIAEHETRAPARYTEAALIAALERNGVGRPSTYATMLKTVRERGYVRLQQKRLIPTDAADTDRRGYPPKRLPEPALQRCPGSGLHRPAGSAVRRGCVGKNHSSGCTA